MPTGYDKLRGQNVSTGIIRKIEAKTITETVRALFEDAAVFLPEDVKGAIERARENETSARAAQILDILKDNYVYAEASGTPVCQDTGMAVVFLDIGQDVHIVGGSVEDAVNEGVRQAYTKGYLRKSVVADPLSRVNTGDNTPAVIHERIVPGDRLRITAVPKGFGSENMSALKLFNPSASEDDIVGFIVDTVVRAGGKPCPPIIIGVGIGGTAEKACLMAKHALTRDLMEENRDRRYAALEKKILARVNATGVGPQGMGGDTTALGVSVEKYPTHIAGLPVAVCLGCHAGRHASATL